MLIRLIFLAVLAWLGFRLVRQFMASNGLPPAQPGANRPASGAAEPERMQRCAHCDTHLPAGESTQSRGRYFCSEAHRDAYFRDHRD